jgi:hypothetical protein
MPNCVAGDSQKTSKPPIADSCLLCVLAAVLAAGAVIDAIDVCSPDRLLAFFATSAL